MVKLLRRHTSRRELIGSSMRAAMSALIGGIALSSSAKGNDTGSKKDQKERRLDRVAPSGRISVALGTDQLEYSNQAIYVQHGKHLILYSKMVKPPQGVEEDDGVSIIEGGFFDYDPSAPTRNLEFVERYPREFIEPFTSRSGISVVDLQDTNPLEIGLFYMHHFGPPRAPGGMPADPSTYHVFWKVKQLDKNWSDSMKVVDSGGFLLNNSVIQLRKGKFRNRILVPVGGNPVRILFSEIRLAQLEVLGSRSGKLAQVGRNQSLSNILVERLLRYYETLEEVRIRAPGRECTCPSPRMAVHIGLLQRPWLSKQLTSRLTQLPLFRSLMTFSSCTTKKEIVFR